MFVTTTPVVQNLTKTPKDKIINGNHHHQLNHSRKGNRMEEKNESLGDIKMVVSCSKVLSCLTHITRMSDMSYCLVLILIFPSQLF